MSQPTHRQYVAALYRWTAGVGGAIVLAAAALDRGTGALSGGALLGVAASFAILALRIASVSKIIAAPTKREAGRGAFLYSLGKLGVAFAALSLGALGGAMGAAGVLAGLFSGAVATVLEGISTAKGHRPA